MAIVLKGYFEIILFISLTLTSRKLVLGFAIRNQALITTQCLVERLFRLGVLKILQLNSFMSVWGKCIVGILF